MVPYNPHIKYFEGDRRDSFMATVTPTQMRLDLRSMTSAEQQDTTGGTLKNLFPHILRKALARVRLSKGGNSGSDITTR